MSKKLLLIFALIFTVALAGCSGSMASKAINKGQSSNPQSNTIISYKDYKDILHTLSKNLKIENYELKGVSDELSLIMIDKELSFNKRKFITLDGTENTSQTQDRIVLENENKKSIALIDLIYLDYYIGNDLLSLDMSRPFNIKNKELLKKIDFQMISYNNIIIKVTLLGDQEVDDHDTFLITKSIVEYLSKLGKNK